jgi:hypothetical protein
MTVNCSIRRHEDPLTFDAILHRTREGRDHHVIEQAFFVPGRPWDASFNGHEA